MQVRGLRINYAMPSRSPMAYNNKAQKTSREAAARRTGGAAASAAGRQATIDRQPTADIRPRTKDRTMVTSKEQNTGPIAPDLVLAVLGLALYWCTSMVFYDDAFLGATGISQPLHELFPVSILSITVATVVLVILDCRGLEVTSRFGSVLLPLAGCIASACVLALAFAPVLSLPSWLPWLFAVLMGCSAAAIMLVWGAYVSGLPTESSYLMVPAAFFLSCLLLCLKSSLPHAGVVAFDTATFAASALCWCVVARRAPAAAPQALRTDVFAQLRDAIPWRMVLVFFCCSLAGAFVEFVATQSHAGVIGGSDTVMAAMASGILLLAVVWLVYLRHRDFTSIWPLFIIVLLGSLMILPVVSWLDTGASLKLIVAEKRCLIVLLWVFLASTIFRNELAPVAVFGIGHVALQSLPNYLGQTAGNAVLACMPAISQDIAPLCIAMAFVIIVAVILALFDKSLLLEGLRGQYAAPEQPSQDPEGSNSLADSLERLARTYGLSQREVEVVELTLRGHTFTRISDELGVTLNTVRSHTRSIYRKLDIHTKQELIMLAEGDPKHDSEDNPKNPEE